MKISEFYALLGELAEQFNRTVPTPIMFHGQPVVSSHPMPVDFRNGKRRLLDLCRLLDGFTVDELNDDILRSVVGAVKPLVERMDPGKLRRGSAGWTAYYKLRDKYRLEAPDFMSSTITGRMRSGPPVQNLPIQSSAAALGKRVHEGIDLMYRKDPRIIQTHDSALMSVDYHDLEKNLAERLISKLDTQKLFTIDTIMPERKKR